MRIGESPGGNVRELIRAAEKFIASGEYHVALEQLSNARKIQPNNAYISAIMERILALQKEQERLAQNPVEHDNPFTVTVGHEYPDGIRPREEPILSAQEVEAQVRRLTTMATTLMERGACEGAFETLMKAYLLDPVSPYVLACEKDLLPAWELFRARKAAVSAPPPARETPFVAASEQTDVRRSESARIEALKQQREAERLDRERTLWREASMPPETPRDPVPDQTDTPQPLDQREPVPRGLTRFRFRNLLS